MIRLPAAVALLCALPLAAAAEVTWSCRVEPVGDGLERTTFRFHSDDLAIAGFALRFVSKRMHNLEPHGLATLFRDNNQAFASVEASHQQDTQWLFDRYGDGPLRIYVAPNDLTHEVPGMISGDFELLHKGEHSRDAVQIVAPAGDEIRFVGLVGVNDGRSGPLRRKEKVSGRVGGASEDARVPGLPDVRACGAIDDPADPKTAAVPVPEPDAP